jgi:hypothetical protein
MALIDLTFGAASTFSVDLTFGAASTFTCHASTFGVDRLLVPTSTLSAMHPLYLPCFHFIRHASTAVDASLLMHAVDASLLMTLMHPHRWCTDF